MKINLLTSLANNKKVQKIVDWSTKSSGRTNSLNEPITNLQIVKKHFPTALTAVLSGLFISDTTKSKNIPKDKKKSLINFYIVNAAIIISGTYAIMPAVERFTRRLGEKFNRVNMQNSERTILEKGLKSMIPIVAIVITSRVISPFIASYFSDKIDKIFKRKS